MSGCRDSISRITSGSSAPRPTRTPPGDRKTYRIRECWRLPSRYQCIRYVVSYPRLSRMTRRNGTTAYRRFCEREVVVAFRAGDLAAVRRAAGLTDFAAFRLGAGTGAARRTARAAGRAAGLAGAGDPFLPAG